MVLFDLLLFMEDIQVSEFDKIYPQSRAHDDIF